jgi:hypothetical protein
MNYKPINKKTMEKIMKILLAFLITLGSLSSFAACEVLVDSSYRDLLTDKKITRSLKRKGYTGSFIENEGDLFLTEDQKYPIYFNHPLIERVMITAEQIITRSVQSYSLIINGEVVSKISLSVVKFPEMNEKKIKALDLKAARKLFRKMKRCTNKMIN